MLTDPEAPRSNTSAPFGRDDWQSPWCADAINAAVRLGLCTEAEAPALLQALADDPDTKSPKRLATRLGIKHARHLLGRGPKAPEQTSRHRRAWCGVGACHPHTRRLEDPETQADCGPCPRCHNSAPQRDPLPADLRLDVGGGVNAEPACLPAKGAPTRSCTPALTYPRPCQEQRMKSARKPAPARCPLDRQQVHPGRVGPTIGDPAYALCTDPGLVDRLIRDVTTWPWRVHLSALVAAQPQEQPA